MILSPAKSHLRWTAIMTLATILISHSLGNGALTAAATEARTRSPTEGSHTTAERDNSSHERSSNHSNHSSDGNGNSSRSTVSSLMRVWGAERALYHRLLDDYNKFMRPVKNSSDTVVVTIGVKLNQILDLQERMQVITTILAIDQEWRDENLQWKPEEFGGISSTYLPCNLVWLPDIVLYNSVSNIKELPFMQSHVSVRHTGHVVWFPLVKLESACKLDVEFYPFDEQRCVLKFGSWSYSMREVDVTPGYTGVERHDYVDNGEFELLSLTASRRENTYDCCPVPIPTLNVNLHFRRRPLFALFTLALPCTMLSLMTTVAFVLPPDSSAKIEVQLSVMLSLTVFMLMIGESMPPTSDTLPLLGIHVVIQMGVTALSFICSIIVLRIVKTDHKRMPSRVKRVTQLMSRWLLVSGYPDDGTGGASRTQQATGDWKLLLSCTKAVVQGLSAAAAASAPAPPPLSSHADCDARSSTAAAAAAAMAAAAAQVLGAPQQRCNGAQSRVARGYGTTASSASSGARAAAAVACRGRRELGGSVGADSGSDGEGGARGARSTQHIMERLARDDERQGRRGDWMLLGLVVDRCLLLLLLAVDLTTSVYIYAFAPSQHLAED